jgi:hypothetical protein
MQKRSTHLTHKRNIVIFQIHTKNKSPICVSLHQNASLFDLYMKIENILYPNLYSTFENNGEKSNNIFYTNFMFIKNVNKIHGIFAMSHKNDMTLTIPKSSSSNVIDFIENNSLYFLDCSQVPQLHNLYKIYVIDSESYDLFTKENNFKRYAYINSLFQPFIKYVKCFA